MDIRTIIKSQRDYFKIGETRNIQFRIDRLKSLKNAINKYQDEILFALKLDLNKSDLEGYTTEIGTSLKEIDFAIKNIKKWSKKKYRRASIINFPSRNYTQSCPFGIVLIISPWNYPFSLAIQPLIGAISGGNCAVVKPSEFSPNVSSVIAKMIEECFDEEYVKVIEGDKEVNQKLLDEKFDYIFFTGSPRVGQIVMEAASKNLTPVTLELGGKSPCIVCSDADISVAAKRITWGKCSNSGQTCVAPDYLLVHKDKKNELVNEIIKTIEKFYGDNPIDSDDYGKIINEGHFQRLIGYLEKGEILSGGKYNRDKLSIEPTIIGNITFEDKIMNEEIFGPILPVLEFEDIDEVFEIIDKNPTPLALYLFTKSSDLEKRIVENISFGGGCINDTIMHVSSHSLPFGGVGESGMGNYHGKWSFKAFTYEKSILKKATWIDIPLRYPPYGNKLKWIKRFFI